MSTRRLIGPTIITLISSGLLVDYVFFRDSWWSIVKLLTKIAAILGIIFSGVFNAAVIGWIDKIYVPVLTLVVAIVSIYVMVARAKNAMSKVTPAANTPLIEALRTDESPQPPSDAIPGTESGVWPQAGLLARLTCAFVAVAALFGVAVCVIVYTFLWRASEKELEVRVNAIAIGITTFSEGHPSLSGISKLREDINRYTVNNLIAYIYITDAYGKIVAYTPTDLPSYLRRDIPNSTEPAIGGIDVSYHGESAFEIARRLGDGGIVRVAFWRDLIDAETRRVLGPIAVSIFAILILAVGLFYAYVNRCINRPFFELVEHANRISKGEFAVQLGVGRQDEFGEIARSLERLRSSLRAMLARLEQRTLTRQ